MNHGERMVGIGRGLEEMEPCSGGTGAGGRETKLSGAGNVYVYDR